MRERAKQALGWILAVAAMVVGVVALLIVDALAWAGKKLAGDVQ